MGIFSDIVSGVRTGFDLLSGQKQYELGKQTNEQNLYLANTAVQRRKADLIAAGMNPALAADGQGATVEMSTPKAPNPVGGALDALTAVANLKSIKTSIEGMKKDNKLKDEQSTLNNQAMLGMIQDLEKKSLELDEKRYNLSKYYEMNLPTDVGGTAAQFGYMLNLLKSTKTGERALDFLNGLDTSLGTGDSLGTKAAAAVQDFVDEITDNVKNAKLEYQRAKGAAAAKKEAIKNRKELEKYKKTLIKEKKRERQVMDPLDYLREQERKYKRY